MAIEVEIKNPVMRVKITGGPEFWSLKAVDMATGRILPLSRSFIDIRYTQDGKIVALVELMLDEVDIEADAEILSEKENDEAKS